MSKPGVIEHFSILLRDLVRRVGDPVDLLGPTGAISRSRYAPGWSKRHFLEWSAPDYLEYLLSKRPLPGPPSHPQLTVFFMLPYSGPGSRRGQDWSRQDWEVAQRDLARIGELWADGALMETRAVLQYHVGRIFSLPLRPT
jgi:hypothetical protein